MKVIPSIASQYLVPSRATEREDARVSRAKGQREGTAACVTLRVSRARLVSARAEGDISLFHSYILPLWHRKPIIFQASFSDTNLKLLLLSAYSNFSYFTAFIPK